MDKENPSNKNTKPQNRRNFLKKSSIVTLAAVSGATLLNSCNTVSEKAKTVNIQPTSTKKYQWRMVTTWPPKFPVLGEGLELMAQWIRDASAGRLDIKVYGAGELIPPLECFDAVRSGGAQIASGVSYYWSGKIPAAQFFAALPFGMNAQQTNAWVMNGGGLKLWEELYAEYGLVPFVGGNTGVQMGGWFRKELNGLEDLKGLKMRMPGLGGKVLAKTGATAVLVPATELYTNLERGVIDATEWIGPYHDYNMGFYNVAKYYYYPGWHEPGPMLELFANQKAFNELPFDLREILRTASSRLAMWTLGEFEAKNNTYLQKLVKEKGVKLRKYPAEIMQTLKKYSKEVVEELANKDARTKKIFASYDKFRKDISEWSKVTEQAFYSDIQG